MHFETGALFRSAPTYYNSERSTNTCNRSHILPYYYYLPFHMSDVFAYIHFLHYSTIYILLPQSYSLKPVISMKHRPAVCLCLLCVSCLDI